MKKNTLIGLFIATLALFTSCKEEKDNVTPTTQNPLTTENLSATIAENPTQGQIIDTLIASGDDLQFSFKSQSVASAFQIDHKGQLSVLTPSVFDYEKRTSITAEINVTDGKDTLISTINITLTDVDETPIFTPLASEDLNVTIDENPTQGDVLGTIIAVGDNLEFSFKNVKKGLIYSIEKTTGKISVLNPAQFDYEKQNSLLLEVNVTDGKDTVVSILTTTLNNVLDIGEFHKGGIVFWLNPNDETEGLVCALEDQSASAPWGCAGTAISGADSKALGDGNQNTIEIEAGCNTAGTAADLCADLTSNNYSDWYLPTENELSEIYSNIGSINFALTNNNGTAFATSTGGGPYYDGAFYWSSSEHIAQSAIIYDFARGQGGITTKDSEYRVRAIRSF